MRKSFIIIMIMFLFTNSYGGFFGGGGSSSSYWQMKTYFETVIVNANTLKSALKEVEQINHMIEQAKKMPEEYFNTHMREYREIIENLSKIQNNTKSILRDARKAELWFKDVYTDIDNKNYENLLDKFTTSIDNLSYDAMKTAGLASEANKKTINNAKTLLQKAKKSENPVQLLEVLSGWSSNLSSQLGSITEVLSSDSRIKALEAAEKAQERKIAKARHDYTQKSLEKTIKKMEQLNNK